MRVEPLHPLRWTDILVGQEHHCVPLNDDREHVMDGNKCWCNPREPDDNIYVHLACDGRELYARGILKRH